MDYDSEDRVHIWGYSEEEMDRFRTFHETDDFPPPEAITPEQTGLTVGEILAGQTGTSPAQLPAVRTILLPARSTDRGIKAYLDGFKSTGLPRPMFAAVTDTNRGWRFTDLVEHLQEERSEIMEEIRKRKEQADPTQ